MTQVAINNRGGDLDAIKSDGSQIPSVASEGGCKLANASTYYFMCGDKDSPFKSIHVKWDATFVGVFTLWECNFPKNLLGMGGGQSSGLATDVGDFDQAKGNWIQCNPSAASVGVTSDDGTTGGASVVAATVTVAGGTAGGAFFDIGNEGAKRLRLRAAVTTGGEVRVNAAGKD